MARKTRTALSSLVNSNSGHPLTADSVTVALLLDGNQKGIEKLHKRLNGVLDGSLECPNCGDTNPKDDNGYNGEERSFLCGACGEVFDAPTSIPIDDLED